MGGPLYAGAHCLPLEGRTTDRQTDCAWEGVERCLAGRFGWSLFFALSAHMTSSAKGYERPVWTSRCNNLKPPEVESIARVTYRVLYLEDHGQLDDRCDAIDRQPQRITEHSQRTPGVRAPDKHVTGRF